MPESDDGWARDDARDNGGDHEHPAGELSVPAEGVAVPEESLAVPEDDTVRVPDEGVAVPDAGLRPPDAGVEPPEVDLEPPRVSMPPLPGTGESRVDAAVAPLRDLGEQPTEEHVAGYEAAHTGLQDVLADLDRDPDT